MTFFAFLACDMNVHKRCVNNVTNTCGIDTKKFGEILVGLGINSEKFNSSCKSDIRKKTSATEQSPNKTCASFNERSHTSPLPNMNDPISYDALCGDMSSVHISFKKPYYPGYTDDDIRQQHPNNSTQYWESSSKLRYSINDFNFIKVLGKGSFGKVYYTIL